MACKCWRHCHQSTPINGPPLQAGPPTSYMSRVNYSICVLNCRGYNPSYPFIFAVYRFFFHSMYNDRRISGPPCTAVFAGWTFLGALKLHLFRCNLSMFDGIGIHTVFLSMVLHWFDFPLQWPWPPLFKLSFFRWCNTSNFFTFHETLAAVDRQLIPLFGG